MRNNSRVQASCPDNDDIEDLEELTNYPDPSKYT